MHEATETSFQKQHCSDCLNWSWLLRDLIGNLDIPKDNIDAAGFWASRESLGLVGFGYM